MTNDQIDQIDKMIQTAGLMKAWDGAEWVDLRKVMAEVVRGLREQRSLNVAMFDAIQERDIELSLLEVRLQEAHAEVQRLGAALRGE